MKLLLFLFLSLGFVISPLADDDKIVWQSGVQLSWNDFKGSVAGKGNHIAMSKCGIGMEQSSYTLPHGKPTYSFYAFFVPGSSWYVKEKVTHKTLQHEQLHFDIAELFARKLRKITLEKELKPDKVKALFNKAYHNYELMQKQYDSETQNGTAAKPQQRWQRKVEHELKKLAEYN